MIAMKKILLFVCLLLCYGLAKTQNTFWSCSMPSGSSSSSLLSITNCINDNYLSSDFNVNYIPSLNSDILNIKFNVHIMQFSTANPQNYEQKAS